jgi:hypothetical protein
MTTLSARNTGSSSIGSAICLIVGLACLAGFAVDFFILAVPPQLGSVQWRVALVQQLADRSIILLFGMALTYYGTLASRSWKQLIAYACMALGVIFILSCVVVLRDSNALHQQVLTNIETQASQLQTQIDQVRGNPGAIPNLTPERIQEASDLLATQANQLKANSKQSILKTGIATVGNLLVIGVSFLGLGLFGSRAARY